MGKRVEDMTEPELRDLMTGVANAVKARLPAGSLFTVLVWDDPKVSQYISNCERASMILALREAADRLQSREDVTR